MMDVVRRMMVLRRVRRIFVVGVVGGFGLVWFDVAVDG
jgi:hypothetical protein